MTTPREWEIDPDGARRLSAALVVAALNDYRAGGLIRERAEPWIFGDFTRLSFDVACDVCGMDPDAIRSRLRRMAA